MTINSLSRCRRVWWLATLFLAFAGMSCQGPPQQSSSSSQSAGAGRFNLVLISIDTLRADHLSLYGYHRPTSPNLVELAGDGVVFENFIHSGGGTLPSHLTMLTSLNPVTHGIHPGNPARLDDARVTLAEQLRAAGYATAAFTDGGWMNRKFGFDQGFEQYEEQDHGHLAVTLPRAMSWVRSQGDRPFFLFLHTYDVHSQTKRLPYDCPGDYPYLYAGDYEGSFDGCRNGTCATRLLVEINAAIRSGERDQLEALSAEDLRFIESLYDGCINYVDEKLRELKELLVELDLYDDTLLVVTSDHGEEFLEHGMLLHDQGGYEELARIPLVLKLPRSAAAGTRVQELAAMVDLMPTLLVILGLQPNPEAQGRSLLPTIFESRPVREAVHLYSVLRTGRWKYFRQTSELYDLSEDPEEATNIAAQRADVIEELEKVLTAAIAADREASESFEAEASETRLELTDSERKRLKALGYLD